MIIIWMSWNIVLYTINICSYCKLIKKVWNPCVMSNISNYKNIFSDLPGWKEALLVCSGKNAFITLLSIVVKQPPNLVIYCLTRFLWLWGGKNTMSSYWPLRYEICHFMRSALNTLTSTIIFLVYTAAMMYTSVVYSQRNTLPSPRNSSR